MISLCFLSYPKHAIMWLRNGSVESWEVSALISNSITMDWTNCSHLSSRYFNSQTKITDEDACDQYELACFDRISRNEKSSKLGYVCQSYIHEYLYGSDSPIPTTRSQWKMMIFLKLNDSSRTYCRSLERIIQVNREIIDEEFDDSTDKMKLNLYLDLFIDLTTTFNREINGNLRHKSNFLV